MKNENFLSFFQQSEKKRSHYKIGLEQELFGFENTGTQRVKYPTIRRVLEYFVAEQGWEAVYENEFLIAAKKDGSSLTLEPGGQFELSAKPIESIREIESLLSEYREQLGFISKKEGVRWLSLGHDPYNVPEEVPYMPKRRYQIMREYLPRFGKGVWNMMSATCGVQTNFDYGSEQDMRNKMLVTTAFSAAAAGLFATSPFHRGKITSIDSWRSAAWEDVDPARTGFVSGVFKKNYGYQEYINYISGVPMLVIQRNGTLVNMSGRNFSELIEGKTEYIPQQNDLHSQLEAVFPVARLKNALETRTTDAASFEMILAQPAFWKGLLYSETALSKAVYLAEKMGETICRTLLSDFATKGMNVTCEGYSLREFAKQAVTLSKEGLEEIASDELSYLQPLEKIIADGETIAEQMRRSFEKDLEKNFRGFSLIFA